MEKHKIIIISTVCFSVALANQRSLHVPPLLPPPKPGMTKEEYHREFEKAFEQQRRQKRERNKEYMDLMAREAWIRLLRVSEKQWKIIEPRYEKERLISRTTRACAFYGVENGENFFWSKSTDDKGAMFAPPKSPNELTEGQKIVDNLIDLLRHESTSDEELRRKIDALQQVRENSRKELPQAKKELAEVLKTPRQEAIFLIRGDID